MSSFQQSDIRPRRPNFGTKGRPIKVYANMFPVKFNSDVTIFHYDVDISPKTIAPINRILFQQWISASKNKQSAKIVALSIYDGQKNIFAPGDLGITSETLSLVLDKPDGGKEQKFTIKIKLVSKLDLYQLAHYLGDIPASTSINAIEYPRAQISALEVLMKHFPTANFINFGRSGSFYTDQNTKKLREGLDLYFGWYQSLRPSLGPVKPNQGPNFTYKQLLINIDVAVSAFYQDGPLVSLIPTFFNKRDMAQCKDVLGYPNDLKRLEKFLCNVVVEIKYRKTGRRKYKIQRLTSSADQSMVDIEQEGSKTRTISVTRFFKEEYNVTLQYPWLPCIVSGSQFPVKIPMELCFVTPRQRHVGKLNELQTADMIKVTAVLPSERRAKIQKGIESLHGSNDFAFLKSWGVEVGTQMALVDARVLPSPKITMNQNSAGGATKDVRDGQWRFGQGRMLAKPAPLNSYAIICFASKRDVPPDYVAEFFDLLFKTMQKDLGNKIDTSRNLDDLIVYQDRSSIASVFDAAISAGKNLFNTQKVDMIFCILPRTGSTHYAPVKMHAEVKLGQMTQCMLEKHVKDDPKKKVPYMMNIALKINSKLGGVNQFLQPSSELPPIGGTHIPTMILGADVTHPPAGVVNGKSIAAVVGSMDSRYCEYRSSIRMQEGRVEIITELDKMVEELFEMFREKAKVYPKRVLFYRDGVSEGQFGEVAYSELLALKRLFAKLSPKEPIQVTFVIINKRHHVRFFPKELKDADKNGNPLAGTVVDREIVHPYEFDFFLNSHPGLQGTSRSSHYHVLYDENKFTADTMQELTYRLCHLFCRATRVVSMVPSAYYAHLVAARARCYVEGLGSSDDFGGDMKIGKVLKKIQQEMYFV